jgi:hypothetical protein
MPMPSGFQPRERQQAQHDHHHHARDTASVRVKHLLRAMAARVSQRIRGENRVPLPAMSASREPDLPPSTLAREISPEISFRCAGNLCVDQKEKSARRAKGRTSSD